LVDQVFRSGIPIFRGVRCREGCIVADCETPEGRTLITKDPRDGTGVDACDPGYVVPVAPRMERFNGGVMRKAFRKIRDYNGAALYTL
jgi:hypothetical protein